MNYWEQLPATAQCEVDGNRVPAGSYNNYLPADAQWKPPVK